MKILALGIIAGLLLVAPALAKGEPTPLPTPLLPPCTAIPVVLSDTLDSARVRSGDVFRFRTVDTIVAPGKVTLPANALGYGVVSFATTAGAHGKGGGLTVEARYIDLGARGRFPVMIDAVGSAAVSQAGASGSLGSVPLPYAGTVVGAYNYLHAGKNAVIRAGLRFIVIPVGDLAHGLRCSL